MTTAPFNDTNPFAVKFMGPLGTLFSEDLGLQLETEEAVLQRLTIEHVERPKAFKTEAGAMAWRPPADSLFRPESSWIRV